MRQQIKPTIFYLSLADRVQAWTFVLLWATLLALTAAVTRNYAVAWITYVQVALFWYPAMTLDGIYIACKDTTAQQFCIEGAQTRRVLATVLVAVTETTAVIVLTILSIESASSNDIARLRSSNIGAWAAILTTHAILAMVAWLHVFIQRHSAPFPGRMLAAKMNMS